MLGWHLVLDLLAELGPWREPLTALSYAEMPHRSKLSVNVSGAMSPMEN